LVAHIGSGGGALLKLQILPLRRSLCERWLRLLDFAARYTAAWCSQEAASVAAFYAAEGSLAVNDSAPAVGQFLKPSSSRCGT
jgi:hypothetical protein